MSRSANRPIIFAVEDVECVEETVVSRRPMVDKAVPKPTPEVKNQPVLMEVAEESNKGDKTPVEVRPVIVAAKEESVGTHTSEEEPPLFSSFMLLFFSSFMGLLIVSLLSWLMELYATHIILGVSAGIFVLTLSLMAGVWMWRERRGYLRLKEMAKLKKLLIVCQGRQSRRELYTRLESVAVEIGDNPSFQDGIKKYRDRVNDQTQSTVLLALFEYEVMSPCDARAMLVVRRACRDVFGLVAISPTTLTDTLLFLARAMRLLREIAECYGQRPGKASTFFLLRRMFFDAGLITVTDVAGDALVQVLGGKALEKVSAMLAESGVASLRMARFGLLAMDRCRPMPFVSENKPSLKDLLG